MSAEVTRRILLALAVLLTLALLYANAHLSYH